MFAKSRKIKISVFTTQENRFQLKRLVESLAVNGREVSANGKADNYLITNHDSDVNPELRKVNISGSRIIAANYSLLIEGVLLREQIPYHLRQICLDYDRWEKI